MVETGIPVEQLANEDMRTITTAVKILAERAQPISRGKGNTARREPGAGGPQYSG